MTIYNVEINRIFKILNDMSIDCKYVNVTVNEVTNTVTFQPVLPLNTKAKELQDGTTPTDKPIDTDLGLTELI